MPRVAELCYPGRWLDHEDHEWSLRVESRFHQLERFLAEAAISLDLFEAAIRRRERAAHARVPWTPALAGETVPSLRRRPESRGEPGWEGWGDGRLPETYEHLVPYVHARAFVGAMDDLGRWQAALESGEGRAPAGGEYGMLGCELLRMAGVDGPAETAMLVLEEREGRWLALRSAGGRAQEVEVSEASLFAARDCVQALIRALPWRGPCRRVP